MDDILRKAKYYITLYVIQKCDVQETQDKIFHNAPKAARVRENIITQIGFQFEYFQLQK